MWTILANGVLFGYTQRQQCVRTLTTRGQDPEPSVTIVTGIVMDLVPHHVGVETMSVARAQDNKTKPA